MDHVAALELGYSRAQNLARTVKNKIGWCARQHKTASFSAYYRASCRIAAATTMLAGASITSDTNVDVLVKLVVAPPTAAAAAASIERIVADQPMRAVKGP